jgi:hypothetical protein
MNQGTIPVKVIKEIVKKLDGISVAAETGRLLR